jgi:hypothetical protein
MDVRDPAVRRRDFGPGLLRTAAHPMSVLCELHEQTAGGEGSAWRVRPLLDDSCPMCVAEAQAARAAKAALQAIADLNRLAGKLHNRARRLALLAVLDGNWPAGHRKGMQRYAARLLRDLAKGRL